MVTEHEETPLLEKTLCFNENIKSRESPFQIIHGEKEDILSKFSSSERKGLTLSWHDVSVQVKPKQLCCQKLIPKQEPKVILKNVHGKVKSGELLAIMGASGSGKTTLLNVLTNRNLRSLDVTGEVRLNGCDVGQKMMQYCAYVQQDDLLHNYLTIREHLIFQAMLSMDKKLIYEEKMTQVENTIMELSLAHCADTKIGIPGSTVGVSGGERKRLAFALEVLTNPLILFCDEPTSGLDSYISLNIVKVLKKLSKQGRTIVFTIHQPSTDVYEILDDILLMAEGRVAYIGSKEGAASFFQSTGVALPENFNPADYFIYHLAIDPEIEKECRQRINSLCDAFGKHRSFYDFKDKEASDKELSLPRVSRYNASWITELKTLLWRCHIKLRRETRVTLSAILVAMITSALVSMIFHDQKLNQKGISNINGALFLILLLVSYRSYNISTNTFCSELPILLREHGNGMYRVDTYFLSKSISDVPVNLFIPFMCTIIFYFSIGLNPEPQAFWICALTITLSANAAVSFGHMISCMCSSVAYAAIYGPSFITPLLIFGGHFLNNASVPKYAMWLRNLSWFFYANEALMANQWQNIHNITCEYEDLNCIRTGEGVLRSLEFDEEPIWMNLLKIIGLLVLFRVLAFLFLLARSYQRS